MANHFTLLFLQSQIVFVFINNCICIVDKTMEEGATGCDAVKASYDKVVRADVFKQDKFILPRIALSSDFGAAPYRSGALGIWQTTADNLNKAKGILKANSKIEKAVREIICIDFGSATQNDMKKPIFSIVCAALLIQGEQGDVPKRFQIDEQKQYWQQASGAQVDKFSDSAQMLDDPANSPNTECFDCVQGPTDMIFVVDDSGSIRGDKNEVDSEWWMQINYVAEVLTQFKPSMDSKTTQAAFVVFSRKVNIETRPYDQDAQSAKNYILNFGRKFGGTCMAHALRSAYDVLTQSTGNRLTDYTVRKFVFILTDGVPRCRPDKKTDNDAEYQAETSQVADQFKQLKEKPTVYALGSKEKIKLSYLMSIASEPKNGRRYDNTADFKSDIKDILFSSCQIIIEIPSGALVDTSGSKKGQRLTFNLDGMKKGEWRSFIAPFTTKQGKSAFLIFELQHLVIDIYASFSQPRPNEAAHDFKERCEPNGRKCVMRIDDPTSQMDDMCKDTFGGQYYVNVHAVDCKGNTCEENIKVDIEIMAPDYFDIYSDQAEGNMKKYQRQQPSGALSILPALFELAVVINCISRAIN